MLSLVLGLLGVVCARMPKSGLSAFSLSAPRDIPSCQATCYSGACPQCNDECFNSKEGNCAHCWVFNQTIGMACLSSDPVASPDCRECWALSPCEVCRTGSCTRCASCQQSREGPCASCWEADSNNFTCVLGYEGRDCKGCWNLNTDSTPIVITSGLTASTLVATWKNIPLCTDSPTPTVIWPWGNLTLVDMLCYTRLLRVTFDPTTKTFHNLPGVNVSVVDFGGFDGLSFGALVTAFEIYGYKEGVNMFGAPFDWRQSSQGSQQAYSDLQALIEKVFTSTKRRVALLAPSYGPQVMLGFLQLMTQEWKDTYLEWFVAASPVWSGSSTALYSQAMGLAVIPNASGIIDRAFRDFEIHLPAMMWLCPMPGNDSYTYNKDMPLLLTPDKNYSAFDLTSILTNVGYQSAVAQAEYLQQSGSLYKFEAPMVNTWISYGYNVETLDTITVGTPLSPSTIAKLTNFTLDSGDNIVTVRSSLRGMLWKDAHQKANKYLIHSGFSDMAHAACLLPLIDPNHTACFYEMAALLLNKTLPMPTPPP